MAPKVKKQTKTRKPTAAPRAARPVATIKARVGDLLASAAKLVRPKKSPASARTRPKALAPKAPAQRDATTTKSARTRGTAPVAPSEVVTVKKFGVASRRTKKKRIAAPPSPASKSAKKSRVKAPTTPTTKRGMRASLVPARSDLLVDSILVPEHYTPMAMALMARDPRNLFAYWDMDPDVHSGLGRRLGRKSKRLQYVLRLFGAPEEADEAETPHVVELSVKPFDGSCTVGVPRDAFTGYAEIGVLTPTGEFHPVARSNVASTPPAETSGSPEATWIDSRGDMVAAEQAPAYAIPFDNWSREETDRGRYAGHGHAERATTTGTRHRRRGGTWVGAAVREGEEEFSSSEYDGEEHDIPHADIADPEATRIANDNTQHQMPDETGMGFHSGDGTRAGVSLPGVHGQHVVFADPTLSPSRCALTDDDIRAYYRDLIANLESGAIKLPDLDLLQAATTPPPKKRSRALGSSDLMQGASENLPGGASEAVPAPGPKSFFFEINTDLIVYGRTEPGATVLLGDQPVDVRSDGTFSLRLALPEGRVGLDFTARSADKSQTRRLTAAVLRSPVVSTQ